MAVRINNGSCAREGIENWGTRRSQYLPVIVVASRTRQGLEAKREECTDTHISHFDDQMTRCISDRAFCSNPLTCVGL